MRHLRLCVVAVGAGAVLLPGPAQAQTAGALDQIVTNFQTLSTGWEAPLRSYAYQTFALLSVITFAWAGIKLAVRNADFSEWIAEVVGNIFSLGFFFLLLQNSVTYGSLIIQSFRQAASSAGGGPMSPTAVFNAGIDLATNVLSQMAYVHPGRDIVLAIGGAIVLACFAFIAAEILIALVESYFIIAAGVFLMGFGGSGFTREIAVSVVRYTVSVGAKLMTLQLILSLGMGIIRQWAQQPVAAFDLHNYCIIIGSPLVLFVLCKNLPSAIQGVVNGSHQVGGAGGLVGAATFVATTAAAVAATAAGAPVAAAQAARLASAQTDSKDAASGSSRGTLSKITSVGMSAAGNLAKSAASDIGRKLSGQTNGAGSAPWRMAADMGNQRRLLNEDQGSPTPPAKSTAKTPENTISG